MRELPISFSQEELHGIFDGTRTQFRYVIDAPNESHLQYQVGDMLWIRERWMYTDGAYIHRFGNDDLDTPGMKWRSPADMVRAAARLFLKVTDVRIQRLQDITPQEAIAEGSYLIKCSCNRRNAGITIRGKLHPQQVCYKCGIEISHLWDGHHERAEHTWDANPWVAANTFQKIEP